MKNSLNHLNLVKGSSCLHRDNQGNLCGAKVQPLTQHGWLCWYHDMIVNKNTVVAAEGA